jgi:2-C-methyl-D-erythritol 4-phosphate cytidylyltransferase/2-C-methyl-D-erythritol 2,4-cyclodiphosphate synthase
MGDTVETAWISVLVAAGRGTRAFSGGQNGATAPAKQYRLLAGKTVLARSIEALLAADARMRVLPVIHQDDGKAFSEALDELAPSTRANVLPPVHGGATRQDSVLQGLENLKTSVSDGDPIVFIHDAARPFVSARLINRLAAALDEAEGAVPALPATDTLKRATVSGLIEGDIERSTAFAVQTPPARSFASTRSTPHIFRRCGMALPG